MHEGKLDSEGSCLPLDAQPASGDLQTQSSYLRQALFHFSAVNWSRGSQTEQAPAHIPTPAVVLTASKVPVVYPFVMRIISPNLSASEVRYHF